MTFKIENRLGVAAPPLVVWEVIADLPSWFEWNPLYTRAEGTIGFGKQLTLTQHLSGQEPETIQPVITSWTPEDLLHWRTSVSGGFLRTTRYLEIHRLGDENCIFSNGEQFAGIAAYFVPRTLRRALRQGFIAMGEALKDRAEAIWRAQAPAPISAP
jgi:hypothetical protein